MAACMNCVGMRPQMPMMPNMAMGGAPQMQMPRMSGMDSMSGMSGMDPMSGMQQQLMQTNQMMMGVMTQMLTMLLQLMMPQQGQAAGSATGAASPSVDAAGGGSSPAGGAAAGAGAVDASQFSGGTANSRTLAAAAEKEAKAEGTTGWCYRGVSRSLKSIGVTATGASAYMAADQLAKNPKMKEIQVPKDQLTKLPPGAVVVWSQGKGHPHGHISVALGDGREASDHVQSQIKDLGGGCTFRVFMPV